MRKILHLLWMLLLLCSVGCNDDQQPPTPDTPIGYAEDHVMILYMQGDNGLETFMDTNLQKALTAYYEVADKGRIVIFYDRGNYTRLTELYLDDGMAKQRLIKEYSTSVSSVDADFMRQTFELIYSEIPAKSYGLILSSHGGGWVPSDIYSNYLNYDWYESGEPLERRPLFYGQDGSDCMELPELVEVLSTRKFDYIIFDACFMASVEGLYDLRHTTDYIIASSAEVRGEGFPYQNIVPLLFRADHGLKESCEAFMEFYEGGSGTISLIDCSQLESLAAAMKRVVNAADETIDYAQIQGYECFPIHLYYDLEQYVEQLTDDETLRSEFRTALRKAVPFTDHTPTFISSAWRVETIDLPRSCGLTCHVERTEFPDTHTAWLQTAWARAIGM